MTHLPTSFPLLAFNGRLAGGAEKTLKVALPCTIAPADEQLAFGILGPLDARREGRLLDIGGQKQKAVLAVLLLHANEVVATDVLIDRVWGDKPPQTAPNTLQVYVSKLRHALGRDAIRTRAPGYVLEVDPESIDAHRFEHGLAAARDASGDEAVRALREALQLWRGPALADFAYDDFAQRPAARLEELRLSALEERLELDLALGRHEDAIGELEALVAEHPLRERPRRLLMLALYRAGRQADALEEYQRARRVLIDELGLDPSPELQRLERAILTHGEELEARAVRVSLPAPATALVDREREVAEACALVRETRLSTLTGPGGIGKTRLALEVAHTVADEFADGVFFVPLDAIARPEHVTSAILRASAAPPSAALADHLRDREVLLLLDNFEHLLQAAPLLTELLSSAPRVKVLVTSRALLRVAGEHELVVPPLADSPALELFAIRARAANREFAVTEENAGALAEICRRLEGLPLALELAAARSRLLPPHAMLERLDRRLALLGAGPRDAPARHQTLRATIDWSYNLLEPGEQMLFRRLGVFAGGCGLEAAEAVCSEGLDDVLGGLEALVEKSLLRQEGRRDAHFSMLETVREYASERLAESGEQEALRHRHAAYFLGFAEAAEPELEGPREREWLDRLEADHANLRAALDFAVDRRDAETALRLAASLRRFWHIHGHLREGLQLLEAALALAESTAPELRAKALNGAGILAIEQGDSDAARAFFEESVAAAHEAGDWARLGSALSNLGSLAMFERDYERARAQYEEAARLHRETGSVHRLAITSENLGLVALYQNDVERAVSLLSESVEIARQAGATHSVAATLRSLARAHLARDDMHTALALLEESLTLALELRERQGIANCLEDVAAACLSDDAERAAMLLGAGAAVRKAIGASRGSDQQGWFDETLAATEAALGERFASELERGRALTLEEAADVALAVTRREARTV